MNELQALLLGLIQGLTEFLPVSSSGHLELASHLLGVTNTENLTFTVTVHAATVLSTLIVFRSEILQLLFGVMQFKWNEELRYVLLLLISAIPVTIVGLFFRDEAESLFTENLRLVGGSLIVTAGLLTFAHFSKREHNQKITWKHSLIIGLAQAVAIIPGISRSGATISTGILLGNKRSEMARFSFLMVLIPILGATFLDIIKGDFNNDAVVSTSALIVGFVSAFVSGLLACRLMIKMVSRGNLIYFALYCLIIAVIAIFAG